MTTEGFVEVGGHKTWYRVAGDLTSPQTPLLLLHGGPGGTSDAFEPLEDLSSSGRPVVRYDQLGSGRSERPADPTLWTIRRFLEELAAVRAHLGLDRVHLLGHSWGGMLALEYLFTRPAGVRSLVLASSLVSAKAWGAEASRLRDGLPAHVVGAMKRHEDNLPALKPPSAKAAKQLDDTTIAKRAAVMQKLFGVISSPVAVRLAAAASAVPFLRGAAYEIVGAEFAKRHAYRNGPMPLALFKMLAGMNRDLYKHMWGPSEFHPTGTLRDWDVTSRLSEVDVPTLITSGRYDESTPAQNEVMRDAISGSEWVVFEHSAHCAMLEEPQRYREVVADFLARVEAG